MVPCRAKPRTAVANRDRTAPESSSNGQRQESFLILIPERYRAVPFEPSDEEEASNDNELLSHLVKDLTDLHFDNSDLTTSICDLKASERKSDLAKYRYISEAIKDHKLDFVAVMETKKKDMSKPNLNHLSGDADFTWHCLSPRGRSGGILLGIN